MADSTLRTRLVLRNDSFENWRNDNKILAKGEPGVAIDPETGYSELRIGDGVHEWNDLTSNFSEAMQKLQKAAVQSTSSVSEMATVMKNFAALAHDMTVVPGDTSRNKYKTLNPKYEVI